jgi:osmotically-inducible protein OsmY
LIAGPWPVPAYYQITIEEPSAKDRATSEAVLEALREEDVPTGEGAVRVCAVGRTVYLLGSVRGRVTAETAERVALASALVDHVRNKLQVAATGRSAVAGR